MNAEQVAVEYRDMLAELTFNSKTHINVLTMLAADYIASSQVIADAIFLKINV
jgi:hypothetical protein